MVDSDPSWYRAVLAKHDRENSIVNVLSVTTEPASKVGDNYASVIVRAILQVVLGSGKVTTKRVILKKALTDIPKDLVKEMSGAFHLEGITYDKILSVYDSIISENCSPFESIWPQCLLTSHNLIMFDDLRVSGFTLGTRKTGLDPQHAKLVFTNLARLHSLSVVAADEGRIFTKILPPYMMTDAGVIEKFFKTSMTSLADVMRDMWSSDWTVVENKIRSLVDDIVPILRKLYNQPHKLSVVNHGDCWVNNMMFKYDGNDVPTKMKFFDFQLCHCNSYAWDLTYFLHSSVHPKYLPTCKDQLVEIYSKEFASNLDRFGADTGLAPTIEEINGEMERLQLFSLAVSTSILPITANPSDIKISLDDMLNEESTKMKELFEVKEFEKTIQTMFRYFIDNGVFS